MDKQERNALTTSDLKEIRKLANNEYAHVRLAVLNNPNTPFEVAESLKDDPAPSVRNQARWLVDGTPIPTISEQVIPELPAQSRSLQAASQNLDRLNTASRSFVMSALTTGVIGFVLCAFGLGGMSFTYGSFPFYATAMVIIGALSLSLCSFLTIGALIVTPIARHAAVVYHSTNLSPSDD